MILQPRHFVRFLDGRAGDKVTIAFLPGHLGGHLQTICTDVSLRLDYARKLNRKHQMTYEKFAEIQKTIDFGYCLKTVDQHLSFLYFSDRPSKPAVYFLLVKTDVKRGELWLVTFHRLKMAQVAHKLRKGELLRDHIHESAG